MGVRVEGFRIEGVGFGVYGLLNRVEDFGLCGVVAARQGSSLCGFGCGMGSVGSYPRELLNRNDMRDEASRVHHSLNPEPSRGSLWDDIESHPNLSYRCGT